MSDKFTAILKENKAILASQDLLIPPMLELTQFKDEVLGHTGIDLTIKQVSDIVKLYPYVCYSLRNKQPYALSNDERDFDELSIIAHFFLRFSESELRIFKRADIIDKVRSQAEAMGYKVY